VRVKASNVCLNSDLGQHTIAVDTHVFRVAILLGLYKTNTPEATEHELEKAIPDHWKQYAHHWLILHGRYVCVARKPRCPECILADLCRYGAKTPPPGAKPEVEKKILKMAKTSRRAR